MKAHISLQTEDGQALALAPDASISIEEQNPLFGDVELKSFPFELPFAMNRKAFKNLDARDSKLRATDVEGMKVRTILDGIPYRQAVLHVQQDQELVDVLPVNLDSRTKSFRDMIEDLKCRDLEKEVAADNIIIGEKIGDIEFQFTYKKYAVITYIGGTGWSGGVASTRIVVTDFQKTESKVFNPKLVGFSYPAKCSNSATVMPSVRKTKDYNNFQVKIPTTLESYINVSTPYPQAKYCNMDVCYAHHGIDEDGKSSSDIVKMDNATFTNEDYGAYWVLDAERPSSGICFYVAYFLEKLFQHLGVAFDMSALTQIEDFNYMCFVTTACKFREERISEYGNLPSFDKINEWLNSRGCGGQVEFDTNSISLSDDRTPYELTSSQLNDCYTFMNTGVAPTTWDISDINGGRYYVTAINDIKVEPGIKTYSAKAYINRMYATADNFPDATVSEIISSLENTFGVRFVYDPEVNKVTVKLLRDVFRSSQAPIELRGEVLSMHKISEKITGVKVRYSGESDTEEQVKNVRYGVRDYDTDYDYIDYPNGRTQIKDYKNVIKKVDVADMNVYVDPATGDAFRIKVDSEATTADELMPTVFEVGQFKGIDDGDCSKDNEDYIKELSSSFQPIVVSDVNFRNGGLTKPDYQPRLVAFMDVSMQHEFIESKVQNTFSLEDAYAYFTYKLKMIESYDTTQTDDGDSPLQSFDWGLTVGILRTGDGGAGVENYDPNYDGFGNFRWRDIADNYCISADTMDATGLWLGKTDKANTFSLKLRAWKPFVYYKDWQGVTHVSSDMSLLGTQDPETGFYWLLPCMDDERNETTGAITKRIRSRGLVDVFLAEYIYFLLHRVPYKVKMLCEVAQLADLPRHWLRRFSIDGKIGWINKLKYDVNVESGIGEVEIEFYAVN